MENKEIKMRIVLLYLLKEFKALNSLNRYLIILIHIIEIRLGINQKLKGIIINPNKVLNQFSDKLNILVEGSKVENKFVIIVNYLI